MAVHRQTPQVGSQGRQEALPTFMSKSANGF